MDDLKIITASNISRLRTQAGMTQIELAEKLNYSDKSVSKWERAEAVPDAYVLKKISEIFNVSVDYLLNSQDEWKPENNPQKPITKEIFGGDRLITSVAIVGILTAALLVFIIFWMLGNIIWSIFIYALPAVLVTSLVLNSIWRQGRYNYWIIALLVLSLIVSVYFIFFQYNLWQMFILLLPLELIVFLCSKITKRRLGGK